MPCLSATTNYKVKHGFTLIELLVVIAIIGMLASFAIASFNSAQAKGRDSRRKADLNAVKTALELAKQDCRGGSWYPLGTGGSVEGNRYAFLGFYLKNTNLNYIKIVPLDPLNGDVNYYYGYTNSTITLDVCTETTGAMTRDGSTEYRLTARLENTSDPQIAASKTKCPFATFPADTGQTLDDYTSVANVYVICND